jgi:membrane-bound lytic murein transglycosylase D
MRHAQRALALVLCLVAGLTSAVAQQSEELFPRPAALEPAVKFWTRVYTEVDTASGFIHDSLRMDIVYTTVRFDDNSQRERRRRVERATALYRDILNKLGGGTRQGLNAEEQRVLGLFPASTTNAEFRAAAERLRFQLGQSDRFRAGLVRSGTWKAYIYEVLDKQGLPRELAALPHVESSFDPTAYSKVGAAGMWQFTRSTGVRYMRVDHIVDERRDPFLATNAAARLLSDNHDVIGSWPLALTAYNHGLSGMRRAVQQQKTDDIATIVAKYQSRSFGFASRNFYTAFLAALEIDTHPERYFPNLRIEPPSDTVAITVPAFVETNTLADALDVRESTLRELNPALMDTVWSGDKYVPQGFELRVPRSVGASAVALLAAIPTGERYAAQRQDREHRVRRGDTLSGIASEYRVSLAALMRVNSLTGRDMIRVGQTIRLPVDAGAAEPAGVVAAAARAAPPATTPAAAVAAAPAPTPAAAEAASSGVYVVRNGDSIERIATRLGVEQGALLAANAIRNKNVIHPGQRLVVPGAAGAAEPAATATLANVEPPQSLADQSLATAELTAALAPAVLENGEPAPDATDEDDGDNPSIVNALAAEQAVLAADPSDYSVSPGNKITVQALETLGHYADWLGIPTQRLRDLNKLSFRDAVVVGQALALDLADTDAQTFEQRRIAYHQQLQSDFFASHRIANIEDHVVKPGESLWLLAERTYKVPVWLLRQYNPDLNLDRVQPGTVVRFPRLEAIAPSIGSATPEAVASSTP